LMATDGIHEEEARKRAALWVPFYTLPYNNDMDKFSVVQSCWHCPGFSSNPLIAVMHADDIALINSKHGWSLQLQLNEFHD
jgi:hypothetical protein